MAIPVTCPSCLKRFSVSDKFAGKSGPCPNCQKTIKIPDKAEEVVIHAPEDAAPKDSKGKSILKPIRRQEVNLSLPVILAASLGTLLVIGLALGFGLTGGAPTILLSVSALLLALPLVYVGYWFLHDDELAGYSGRELLIRCGICAVVFAATWAIYAFIPSYLNDDAEVSGMQIVILLPAMIGLGMAAAVLALELEILQGVLLYAFYLGITFLLAWLADAPLTGPREIQSNESSSPPALVRPQPKQPKQTPSPVPAPQLPDTESGAKVPNLLQ